MKLRRLPEDFQVDELSSFAPTGGRFALFRLTKRSIGTPEAIEALARRWDVPRKRIGYGGLKDRHAVTAQYITVENGPRQSLEQENLEAEYLGQAGRPFTPHDIAGNRFQIVLRHLRPDETDGVEQALAEAIRDGIPNYFDDQRFGSVTSDGEFMAVAWCRGDYERAFRLAVAEHNPHDRPKDREEKAILRQHWGEWRTIINSVKRGTIRNYALFLVDNPTDFRRALAIIRQDLRSLYLSAFQSFLWNQILSALLAERCRPEQICPVPLAVGPVSFPRGLDPAQREELAALDLQLPSARAEMEPGPMLSLVERVLAGYGLQLRELRVKYPRDSFFSKGTRRAMVRPENASHTLADDELYPGRRKLTLSFDLPRGSYATILVKRITEVVDAATDLSDP